MRLFLITIILQFIFCTSFVFADQSLFYKEVNLIGGYSNEDQWIGRSSTLKNSIGFEDYRKFSNEYGDFLTTDLQIRVPYDSQQKAKDAFGIEVHNAYLAYKYSLGHDLKIGHFDPEFGLEPVVDTHGTILQTLIMDNIGFKKDWGVALEGAFSGFDYKAGLQLGSGMAIRMENGNYLTTARIGAVPNNNFQYGISFLWGEVLKSKGMRTLPRDALLENKVILKRRLGFDLQYLFGPWQFKGETAYGKDYGNFAFGYLTEIGYTVPEHQNCELALQFKSWINDLGKKNSDDSTLIFCVSYKISQKVTFRISASHDFNRARDNEDTEILAQFYYYGI